MERNTFLQKSKKYCRSLHINLCASVKTFLPFSDFLKTHHEERVADPQAAPAHGALWDGDVLAVHRNGN